ncbi:hypothetical protein PAXRUDRAFT_832945 [Paxillus rubicundulus Ve08.2h10]|uniref:Secreted protein n=1 Tax=Paxillus rubicundulus Ve08.2h10 TaxID=930991 RepID=A0A0D0CF12_9AGAM|nr:hypothetical protein PAXRUDRAFT_832945 [Paxillus rubicundulus Ve08.2h10]
MKTFLALLAAITFSGSYLVGVHAQHCALCPSSLGHVSLGFKCVYYDRIAQRNTACVYLNPVSMDAPTCLYNPRGGLISKGSDAACQKNVATDSSNCPNC